LFLPSRYGEGAKTCPEYTESMAVLELDERYQGLVEELLAEVSVYNPGVDRELVTRAFLFAASAHEGQQRRSGEDFIHHPYGVALVLANLRLDEQTLAAAEVGEDERDAVRVVDEVLTRP